MQKESKKLGGYIFGFIFYFGFFAIITQGIAIIFYIVLIPLAFTPLAESLWRKLSGVRPLELEKEKDRLLPLFKEVYVGAVSANPKLSRKIRLYIHEDMEINAYAFGRKTLILTRGSIEQLNDECLKGSIAHEFGHFSNYDTHASLLMAVGNLPLTFIVQRLYYAMKQPNEDGSEVTSIFKGLYFVAYCMFKVVHSIGDFFLKITMRKGEYSADNFAIRSGFGNEIAEVLNKIYSTSFSKPQSVREQLKSTHPPITKRIERVQTAIH